ncbi:hypothetical protein, partial [Streptomyces lonarensis]
SDAGEPDAGEPDAGEPDAAEPGPSARTAPQPIAAVSPCAVGRAVPTEATAQADATAPVGGTEPVGPRADGGSPLAPGLDDELALRRLLRDSVRGIEPSAESLAALQRAVPARRRRRRRLMTAATTVAVLAVGAPVTLHAASVVDTNTRTVGAGSDRAAEGATLEPTEIGDGPGSPAGGGATRDEESAGEETAGPGTDPETGEPIEPGQADSAGPDESAGTAGSYPRCDRDQLGDAVTALADPDSDGVIYGSILVSNVSASTCRVRGTDELTATAVRNTAAASTVSPQVVLRTSGDRAVGLPLPDRWVEELVLPPGEAYEVRFAWVPSRSAPDGGCSVPDPEPLPTDIGSGGGSATGGASGGSGSSDEDETGLAAVDDHPGGGSGEDLQAPDDGGSTGGGGSGSGGSTDGPGGSAGGSGGPGGSGSSGNDTGAGPGGPGGAEAEGVLVRYTPASGTPRAAQIELVGVCAGSLHRTGVLVPTV